MQQAAAGGKVLPAKPARLLSLDALRGFDMFWIMSGEHVIHAMAKATGWPVLLWMSGQLHHTEWNGITFYDMIFPLFLFIAGVSMPYSFHNKMEKAGVSNPMDLPGAEKKKIYISMIRRTLILLFLGVVVNGLFRFDGYEHTRFASVLGRIGLAWFFAGIIFLNFDLRGQLWCFAGILIGYWAAMMFIPVPGYGAGVLTMQGSLESYVDQLLLPGRLHDPGHDPEGILSTIPAIGSALLGVFTGQFLKLNSDKWPMYKKGIALFATGLVLIALGSLWDLNFPINKRLWSSSFVLFVGGWSLLFLSVFYLIIDVAGYKKWTYPFMLIGVNSILIYLAAEGIVDFKYTSNFVFGGLIHLASVNWQETLAAIGVVLTQLALLYLLYKNKIFLKI
ncbi:Predicted acyltransferase [Pedobacter westerhofensis]|uniref:Predicted acyltransferase n=2 Tax=Pedobacter westerhofensis TaxID=425512 RepID=A0A521FBY7_9SPHI|nr:Predicted acyltransferase [Pedobacter westerhofensis]